ncbi:BTAD domain-containing putative transcriptional regulator [Micromonospora sp. GCM10011542]|uniref:AfsR/SARP family transcriptional regulator n=1 Tax=Micromonospora sp. GCM10011542 TaxID=3317337 RepID=UPI003620C125
MSELEVRHAVDEVSLQLLGPVRLSRGGRDLAAGPPQRRAVLALLALAGGQPVGRTEICAALWPVRAPAAAWNVVQTHIKNLRQVLEPGRRRRARSVLLPSVGSGYALRLVPSAVDALRFRVLVGRARRARRVDDRGELRRAAGEALRLWRPPLPDVPGLGEHVSVTTLVSEQRLVLGWYADVMIRDGRGEEVLTAVEEDARRHPLDEQAQARLLRLYAALGRRADGVQTYHVVRTRLRDELAIGPGVELSALYRELIRHEGGRVRGPSSGGPPVAPSPPPASPSQLPARPAHFVGRAEELRRLDRATWRQSAGPVLLVIQGPAGVGKSALALQWAHRVAGRFTDGQLYANVAASAGPAEVLRNFLDALRCPTVGGRAGLDALAATYRSALASRRLVIVLDDVRGPGEVRPLLPGSGPSVVVVTTREPLGELLVECRSTQVRLGPLPPAEALDFVRRLGLPQPGSAGRGGPGRAVSTGSGASAGAADGSGGARAAATEGAGGGAAIAYASRMRGLLSQHPEPAAALVAIAVAGGLAPGRAARLVAGLLDRKRG